MHVLEKLIPRLRDSEIRDIVSISQKTHKYPLDAVTDGSLEELIRYILELEAKVYGESKG
jgi:hypothetical protein